MNVAAAATFFNDKPGVAEKWDRFTTAQKWAAGALAFPVALLNLIILAFAVALFLTAAFAKAASGGQLIAAAIAVIAVAAAVWAYLLLRRGGFSLTTYRIPLIVAMGVAALAALGVIAIKSLQTAPLAREIAQGIVAVLLLAAALVGTAAIASAYDTIRPGAREAFCVANSPGRADLRRNQPVRRAVDRSSILRHGGAGAQRRSRILLARLSVG